MAWMIKYEQLDDDQKSFVDSEINKSGNIWIQGFAGSGKSVMLVHALKKKKIQNPNAKVCVVVFTHSLIEMFKAGLNEIQMGHVPIMTYFEFIRSEGRYDYIFVDEVQDLPEDVLRTMRSRGNHVHVAGDSNQSIYEDRVTPSEIGDILSARPFFLNRIYRLTRSIMKAVSSMIPNLDIFGARRDMTKQDISIRLAKGNDIDEEVNYVWEQANEAASEGYSSVILLPTHDYILNFVNNLLIQKNKNPWVLHKNRYGKPDYDSLNSHLRNQGIKLEYVGNSYGSFINAARNRNVILMTYHSAKGMDFDNVFLPFLNNDTVISKYDPETLLMVAMTRSKKNLFLSYSTELHYLVKRFESSCQKVSCKPSENDKNLPGIDFDF